MAKTQGFWAASRLIFSKCLSQLESKSQGWIPRETGTPSTRVDFPAWKMEWSCPSRCVWKSQQCIPEGRKNRVDKKCPQQVVLSWGQVHINLLVLIQALSLFGTSRIRIHPEALSFGKIVPKRETNALFILVLKNAGINSCKIDRCANPLGSE